jgi:hypothetical protein
MFVLAHNPTFMAMRKATRMSVYIPVPRKDSMIHTPTRKTLLQRNPFFAMVYSL